MCIVFDTYVHALSTFLWWNNSETVSITILNIFKSSAASPVQVHKPVCVCVTECVSVRVCACLSLLFRGILPKKCTDVCYKQSEKSAIKWNSQGIKRKSIANQQYQQQQQQNNTL